MREKEDSRKKSKLTIKQLPLPAYEHGKLPPQALELEEAVLGALMLEKKTLTVVLDKLSPINFYKEANQILFQCIVNLAERSAPSDYLMVINELKSTGELEFIGGPYYITQLTGKVGSTISSCYIYSRGNGIGYRLDRTGSTGNGGRN